MLHLLVCVIFILNYFTCSIITTVNCTSCSFVNPETVMIINRNVREIINKCGYSFFFTKQNMLYIKKIKRNKMLYISICELYCVTKNIYMLCINMTQKRDFFLKLFSRLIRFLNFTVYIWKNSFIPLQRSKI